MTIYRKKYIESGLTYGDILDRSGLSRALISKILDNPEKCELDSITRFADAVGMDRPEASAVWAEAKKKYIEDKINAQIGG